MFHFQMAEGGGVVYHDNLDWSLGLKVLPGMAEYRSYEATRENSEEERAAAVREARDAVRASLGRGVPAMVWNPRTAAQERPDTPAAAGCAGGSLSATTRRRRPTRSAIPSCGREITRFATTRWGNGWGPSGSA